MMLATLFIIGFILAGSDGPLFPWINIAGTILAMAALVRAGKPIRRLHNGNLH